MMTRSTHKAFADESSHNIGRFRSIGLISAPLNFVDELSHDLSNKLKEAGYSRELKWANIADADGRRAALTCIDYTIKHCSIGRIRVDVLTWDTHDPRHSVENRDDAQNLARMYYHLFHFVVREQWPKDSSWELNPDENSLIDWNTLKQCLDLTRPISDCVRKIEPVDSKSCPLVQLADFFAGMCRYSKEKYPRILSWQKKNSLQLQIFEERAIPESFFSKSDEERCLVINRFNENCKNLKLGVSLNTHGGLRTLDSSYPINFWWYVPQHETDKAPQKMR